jgi:multiple sugar transport system ATP-binding protein
VREAAQILEIEDLFKRKPKELSGGQRQRVALGRAIVRKPNVFLFVEPLSNLDAKLRVQMRTEIKKLHLRLKTTMVYVTHDQVEAMTMGDRIVVMRAGIIHQIDDPLRLYNHPADLFVAGFIGSPSMNFLPAVLRADPLRAEEGKVSILLSPDHRERLKEQLDREIILGIRPEHLHLVPPPEIPVSEIRLTHEVSELMGNETYLYLTTGRTPVVCRAPQTAKTYSMNETVTLYCDIGALHYFEKDYQRAL